MISHSKSSHTFILLLILIIFGYVVYQKLSVPAPTKTIYPESYPSGTKVSVYDQLPPSFPKGIVSQDRFHSSGEVTLSSGKVQSTVSYMTRDSILPVSVQYKKTLLDKGWQLSQTSTGADYFSASFSKGTETMMLTIGHIKDGVYLVTLQYEK